MNYGYDDLYRLTTETISGATAQNGTVGYQYDSVGNRAQISSTLPAIPASGLLNYDANDRDDHFLIRDSAWHGRLFEAATKTGERRVSIPPITRTALLQWRGRSNSRRRTI